MIFHRHESSSVRYYVSFLPSISALLYLSLLGQCSSLSAPSAPPIKRRVSLVTGGSGYVGREVIHTLLSNDENENENVYEEVICLVRPPRVQEEETYWSSFQNKMTKTGQHSVKVMPYDMLDGGKTLDDALSYAYRHDDNTDNEEEEEEEEYNDTEYCLYHLACIFGPTQNHIQTAHDTITGVSSTLQTLSKYSSKSCKFILTSSMAAVRGTNQIPLNKKYYTHEDWNTMSKLEDDNWGSSYQWSKMESERVAWELAKEYGVKCMVSLCPSFVFGPQSSLPSSSFDKNDDDDDDKEQKEEKSRSYSLSLVNQWMRGESPVQSRLCIDIRDVAKAHVYIGRQPSSSSVWGQRFILSTEARISSTDMARALQKVARGDSDGLVNAEDIYADTNFKGGAIAIGDKEVECAERLKTYFGGLVCRSVEETMEDMGRALLLEMKKKKKQKES